MNDPEFRPEAFLVDLDGVLVHSHGLHLRAYELAFERHGLELGEEARAGVEGGKGRRYVLEAAGVPQAIVAQVAEAKETAFLELVAEGGLEPAEGVDVFLEILAGAERPAVVVSNSATARECVEAMGWASRFRGVVGADDVERLKPDPEPYRVGARLAGAHPERSWAFEDSSTGAAAARAAGCFVAGVGPGVSADQVDAWAPALPSFPLERWLSVPDAASAVGGGGR